MNDYFITALQKLLKHEGGYVHDPDDKGGETYCGISRNNFPNWDGWLIIDPAKQSKDFKDLLKSNFNLKKLVEQFYFIEFWSKMQCDSMPEFFAHEMFELSVNCGITRATIILQSALNVLNNNQKKYYDIKTDGKFGPSTLATLEFALDNVSNKLIFNVVNIFQGSFYLELMIKNPVYEKYIGWFNRIEIIK